MYLYSGYVIKCEHEHYIALDKNGHFICSGDTFKEVEKDVDLILNKESHLILNIK